MTLVKGIVEIAPSAQKQLRSVPRHVVRKLMLWIAAVEHDGLAEVRKASGYHDEPLKGRRKGQRSIRLSRQWRAIYVVSSKGVAELVTVKEVTLHAYEDEKPGEAQ